MSDPVERYARLTFSLVAFDVFTHLHQHPPQSLESPLNKGRKAGWVLRKHSP
jgi:hypothetical protein